MVLKIVNQGQHLTVRDESGKLVRGEEGKVLAAKKPPHNANKETWRKSVSRLTDDGRVLHRVLMDLALGNAYEPTLPDGRKAEPVVPSPEVRRASAVDLLHMLHGKPVAQTEVMRSEQEAQDMMQYSAMTDEQLRAIIEGEYKVLPNGTSDADSPEEESD